MELRGAFRVKTKIEEIIVYTVIMGCVLAEGVIEKFVG
jgi:hypothetical protein